MAQGRQRKNRAERSREQARVAADFIESRGWRARAYSDGYSLSGPTAASVVIFPPGPVEGNPVGILSGLLMGPAWDVSWSNERGERKHVKVEGDALNAAGKFMSLARGGKLHQQYTGKPLGLEIGRRGEVRGKSAKQNPAPKASRAKNPSGVSLRSIMSKALK